MNSRFGNPKLLLVAVVVFLAAIILGCFSSQTPLQVSNAAGVPITDPSAARAAVCAGSPRYSATTIAHKTQSDYEFGEPVTARKPDDIRVALQSYINRDPAAASAITASINRSTDALDSRTALFAQSKTAWCSAVDKAMSFVYKANISITTIPKGTSSLYMVASQDGKSVSLRQDATVAPHPAATFTLGKRSVTLRLDQSFAPVQAKTFAYAYFLLSPCHKYADQRC